MACLVRALVYEWAGYWGLLNQHAVSTKLAAAELKWAPVFVPAGGWNTVYSR